MYIMNKYLLLPTPKYNFLLLGLVNFEILKSDLGIRSVDKFEKHCLTFLTCKPLRNAENTRWHAHKQSKRENWPYAPVYRDATVSRIEIIEKCG
jgi:hypothetical protein